MLQKQDRSISFSRVNVLYNQGDIEIKSLRDLGRTILNFSRTLPRQKKGEKKTKRVWHPPRVSERDLSSYRSYRSYSSVTTNFRRSERASEYRLRRRRERRKDERGGRGQNGKDDWSGVRREARILSESNYRAGRAVVINQIPRRDDATKTNRPQGNPLVKHACLACIIFDRRARKSCERARSAHLHVHTTRTLALARR